MINDPTSPPPAQGSAEATQLVESIQPYKIHVPSKYLNLTRQKLELVRLPNSIDTPEDQLWSYGTPKKVVEELLDHWLEKYDWRKEEAKINDHYPQYRTQLEVEGCGSMRIHFVWKKSPNPNAIPLLLLHGWPGSFLEFEKILEPLTNPSDPAAPSFHIVAPSLPGFAFSDGTKNVPGVGPEKTASLFNSLMEKLSYPHYLAHGGDWGAMICRALANNYSTNCRATHVTYLPCYPPTITSAPLKYLKLIGSYLFNGKMPWGYSTEEIEGIKAATKWRDEEAGYFHIQASKPQTLAYALTDSPVGLLAWVREKMHSWTDAYAWDNDQILNWVFMYWIPGAQGGLRYYKEFTREGEMDRILKGRSRVPLGISHFKKEILDLPRDWAELVQPVKFYRRHEAGGHFAAVERPDELVTDLREYFKERIRYDAILKSISEGH